MQRSKSRRETLRVLSALAAAADCGAWIPATLDRSGNPYAWTIWNLETEELAAGEHTLVSNAVDALGREQPADLSLKKTSWEDNAQFPRTVVVGA